MYQELYYYFKSGKSYNGVEDGVDMLYEEYTIVMLSKNNDNSSFIKNIISNKIIEKINMDDLLIITDNGNY